MALRFLTLMLVASACASAHNPTLPQQRRLERVRVNPPAFDAGQQQLTLHPVLLTLTSGEQSTCGEAAFVQPPQPRRGGRRLKTIDAAMSIVDRTSAALRLRGGETSNGFPPLATLVSRSAVRGEQRSGRAGSSHESRSGETQPPFEAPQTRLDDYRGDDQELAGQCAAAVGVGACAACASI